MPSAPQAREKLHLQLARLFRSKIAAGDWAVGQSIPTVQELEAQHNVSRTTVRMAVHALIDEGLWSQYLEVAIGPDAEIFTKSPVLSTVGRLDRETSGLLLLTDDGQLLHRIISPKAALPKVYEATLAEPLRGNEAVLFASGAMLLEADNTPLKPAVLDVLSPTQARLTITEGRYHQVRRMFAAVGNHVVALHRSRVGGLGLDDLPESAWRALDAADIERLMADGRP